MLGNGSPPTFPAATTLSVTVGPPIYALWAPTTRDRTDLEHGPSDRNSDRIYFTGWKDRIAITLGDAPLIWRRIVFWSYSAVALAISPTDPGTGDVYRRVEPFSHISQAALVESFWKGTLNRDWHSDFSFDAKFDNHRNRVISDRKRVINPKFAQGFRNYFLWYPIRRWIQHDDEEAGSDTIGSVWAATTPNSPGNLYVLDVFALAQRGTDAATVRYESTVYWREL